jgi:ERCC4-related helicase
MTEPKIIDNQRVQLQEVLKAQALKHSKLSIATGYWDLEATASLLEELEGLKRIRLLIGREPLIPRHQLSAPEQEFPGDDFKYDLANLAPDSNLKETAARLRKWIESGKLEVKVFTGSFLHAKAYIFGDFDSKDAVGIIGSSNFTRNGLLHNTELNALEPDHRVVAFQPKSESQDTGHLAWFQGMWENPLAVEWTEKFGQIIEQSPVGDLFYSPFEMYMKTLHVLFNEELEDEQVDEDEKLFGKTLFDFQKKNTRALIRRLKKYQVAMLSDSVGLGKTTTAINVIKEYFSAPEGKKRVEIICPKSIVKQWEKELTTEGIFGHTPITLQNPKEIESKQELDNIAAVSLFVIDESHNLRKSSGVRFNQMLAWIRKNPKAHVLLLTATPINNNLSDLSNQILLGAGGDQDIMKITIADGNKQVVSISFYQAIENLKKKISQDIKRTGKIDYQHIRNVITPIIRTFVVRRTRQGIEKEYGALEIDGQLRSFPKVIPGVSEYAFDPKNLAAIKEISSEVINLEHLYQVAPEDLMDKCKDLVHPYHQALKIKPVEQQLEASTSPMFYIFQLIMTLGFVPYRWMMYQTKYHGKTRQQIGELNLPAGESKKLLLQLGIFGILRTVFLKRMESSVSAMRTSVDTYLAKLEIFERGILEDRIVPISDIEAVQASFDEDEDEEVDLDLLEKTTLEFIEEKNFEKHAILEDIKIEKALVRLIVRQLEVIEKDDSKIKAFASEIDQLRAANPKAKVLVFSYFSDTVKYLQENIFKYSTTSNKATSGFVGTSNRGDSEKLASLFSPKSKLYSLKPDETELNLLISTDVLSEGQNLQDCGILINYDLHWNPVRMIQRNGRVNRLGSDFPEVNVINMKPESELDGYLKLIQRLQGKIDIIRNTIGTDTPVLDEPENPIEYADAVSDIYSKDLQKRMKALEDAEKAADFLFAEDEFVMDLKTFYADPQFTEEYKKEVFGISPGKWGVLPKLELGEKPKSAVIGLSSLLNTDGEVANHQFVEVNPQTMTVNAIGTLQALDHIRTGLTQNERSRDASSIDKVASKSLMLKGALAYGDNDEVGALIGQENTVLQILYQNEYSEDDINLVRDAFKTKDTFFRKEITSIKTKIMTAHKNGSNNQPFLKEIITKASEIADNKADDIILRPASAALVLAYMDETLNG